MVDDSFPMFVRSIALIVQISKPRYQPLPPSKVNLSTMMLTLLGSLRFFDQEKYYQCFLTHEVTSFVLSMILCVMDVGDEAHLSEVERDIVNVFRLPKSVLGKVVTLLRDLGFNEEDDPIEFISMVTTGKHSIFPHTDSRVSFNAGFRSLVVWGWFQVIPIHDGPSRQDSCIEIQVPL